MVNEKINLANAINIYFYSFSFVKRHRIMYCDNYLNVILDLYTICRSLYICVYIYIHVYIYRKAMKSGKKEKSYIKITFH